MNKIKDYLKKKTTHQLQKNLKILQKIKKDFLNKRISVQVLATSDVVVIEELVMGSNFRPSEQN